MRTAVLLLLLCFMQAAAATELHLSPHTGSVAPTRELRLLEDHSGQLSFEQARLLLTSQGAFWDGAGSPAFGFSDAVYWAQLDIHNSLSQPMQWVVRLDRPGQDQIAVFHPHSDGSWQQKLSGTLRDFDSRDLPYPVINFVFTVQPEQALTLYFRVSDNTLTGLPIRLMPLDDFVAESTQDLFFDSLEFGGIALVAVLMLALGWLTRRRSFLWLGVTLGFVLLFAMTFNGYAFQFLWPHAPLWNHRAEVLFDYLASAASLMFVSSALQWSDRQAFFRRLLHGSAVIIALIACAGLLVPANAVISTFLMAVTGYVILLIVVVCVAAYRAQPRGTRFLIVALLVFLAGVSLEVLGMVSNALPALLQYHSSTSVMVLALALIVIGLADVIRQELKTQQQRQTELLATQNQAFEQLRHTRLLRDEFIDNMSSEVQTPVHGMLSLCDSLQNGSLQNSRDAWAQDLQLLHHNMRTLAASAHQLIDRATDAIAMDALQLKQMTVDLTSICIGAATSSRIQLSAPRVPIHDRYREHSVMVLGDPSRLRQVLLNLLFYAIRQPGVDKVRLSVGCSAGVARVEIRPSGADITAARIEKSLRAIEGDRSRPDTSGMELPLFVSSLILDLHGTEIRLETNSGRLIAFSFELPAITC